MNYYCMLRFSPDLYDVCFLDLVRTGLNSSTRPVTLLLKSNQDILEVAAHV
jgi:hypothetical protein